MTPLRALQGREGESGKERGGRCRCNGRAEDGVHSRN